MAINFISDKNITQFKDKTCFLRIDLNIKKGKESESFRIKAIIPTLKLLKKHNIKTIIASHRGRFEEGTPTLKPFSKILSEKIGSDIKFIKNNFSEIKKNEENQFFLIENLRNNRGEESNSKKFAKELSYLADFYIQDGFAVCHRKNASIYHLPKMMPSFGGLLLKKEIDNLNKATKDYKTPLTVIIGGAKTKTKIGVLDNLWNKADYFLLGGGPAHTFLHAQGEDIKNSIYDPTSVQVIKERYLGSEKIKLPVDVKEKNNKFLDIGKKTERYYSGIIEDSRTIIWNGPLGYYEDPEFAHGSQKIAESIANSKSFSVIGGGETTTLISEMNMLDKFSFVSTGGGAMLEFLSNNEMPGLKVLEQNHEQ